MAFYKSNISAEKEPLPDIEIIFVGGGVSADQGSVIRVILSISEEVYNIFWKPLENRNVVQVKYS